MSTIDADIFGPKAEVEKFHTILGWTGEKNSNGYAKIKCPLIKRVITIDFEIEGKTSRLPSRAFIIKDSEGCYSRIRENKLPASYGTGWLLGTIFHRYFYIEYDLENLRLGFADAINYSLY